MSEERGLIEQFCKDLNQAHDEICKLQDLIPFENDWPAWTPQANSIRQAEKILGKKLAKTDQWTLFPSGNIKPKTCLTDGNPVTPDHKEIDPKTGMQKGYVVLCPEERAKGYVRPLRESYKHVGRQPKYPLRELTEEEHARYNKYGYVAFEPYPESESPKTGRFWTQEDMERKGCGVSTYMAPALCETYARNPKFYGGTFCSGCGKHFPVEEFIWDEDGQVVGS